MGTDPKKLLHFVVHFHDSITGGATNHDGSLVGVQAGALYFQFISPDEISHNETALF